MTYVTVDVEVDMSDFDTEDLMEELSRRGKDVDGAGDLTPDVVKLYERYTLGKPIDDELREIFWKVLGRIA